MARQEEQEEWELRVETCRIDLWRGYVTSSFVARLVDGADPEVVVDTSSSFRWRGSRPPDTEEARLAHHELVSRLKSAGWSTNGEGGEWYETELSRPTLVPPREADAEEMEKEPAPTPPPPAPVAVALSQPLAPSPSRPRPEPERAAAAQRVRPQRDRWRHAAMVGLLIAIVFLVVVVVQYR